MSESFTTTAMPAPNAPRAHVGMASAAAAAKPAPEMYTSEEQPTAVEVGVATSTRMSDRVMVGNSR